MVTGAPGLLPAPHRRVVAGRSRVRLRTDSSWLAFPSSPAGSRPAQAPRSPASTPKRLTAARAARRPGRRRGPACAVQSSPTGHRPSSAITLVRESPMACTTEAPSPDRVTGGRLTGPVLFLGVDLAWREREPCNETGVVALEPIGAHRRRRLVPRRGRGRRLDDGAGASRTPSRSSTPPCTSPTRRGQRPCETEVARRYGRWKVAANATNLGTPHQAGASLKRRLEALGWAYDDGLARPAGLRAAASASPSRTRRWSGVLSSAMTASARATSGSRAGCGLPSTGRCAPRSATT